MIMRLIKQSLLTLTIGVTATTALAEDLRFTVWTGSAEHLAMLNGFADGFKQNHPDVNVDFETIAFGDYIQKLTLQIGGGNPPDMGWMLEGAAPTFISADVLHDIGPALTTTADYQLDDFADSAMGLWRDGSELYGVPFSTSPFVMFYNADLFEAAGLQTPAELAVEGNWTWEALRDASRQLAALDQVRFGFESMDGQGYDARVWDTLVPLVRAYGEDVWQGSTCRLDSPAAIEAVSLYHSMIFDDGSAVPPGENGDFFNGQSAMTYTQISRVSKLADASFSWGIAPMPTGPAGDSPIIGQAAIVVFKDSPNRELATEFLAYMTDRVGVERMAEYFPPARSSVLASDVFLTSNPNLSADMMQIVGTEIANGSVLPAHEKLPMIRSATRGTLDQLWREDADISGILNQACAQIEREL
ncbi:MAG: sugar ABC transporter substrate-binding protein [Saccharospirillum sp.]|uniref:ABC transporter substrate-binding protein n=1 Tax=Saccharospirillum sp. TaxID=2033801 RepID=UPI0032990161